MPTSEAQARYPLTQGVNPWLVTVSVMLPTFMEVLDTAIASVALPYIAGSLSSTNSEATWVLTSYLVANAVILPASNWFARRFGRKRFLLTCVIIFTVASFFCGAAPSLGVILLARVLQGAGGGALQPLSQSILLESFPAAKRSMAMAAYGLGIVVAPVLGPTLGGWLTDNYSWRWIFLINIPVGLLSMMLSGWLLRDPHYLERKNLRNLRIDYMGLGLIAVGLGFLEVMLDKGQREDWFSSHLIVASAVIACVCLVGAFLWEWRDSDPVVTVKLLRDRNFGIATLAMFLLGFVLYGSTMLLPVLLQTLLGYTALMSGLALSPAGVANLVLLPVVGKLIPKVQARWLVIFGLVVSAAGLFQMAGFNTQLDFRTAMMARLVQSAGLSFLFVPLNTIAFSYIAKERVNRATGMINLARNIGGSCGIAMVTTMLARRAQFHQNILVSHLTPYDFAYREMLSGAARMTMAHGTTASLASRQAQGMLYGLVQRESAMMAFVDNFWLLGVTFLALIPVMLMVKSTTHRRVAGR